MKIFSLGIFFLALTQTYQDFLVAVKKHHAILPLLGVSLVLSIALNYGAVQIGMGIEGVAFITCLISLLNFTVTYFLAARQLASFEEALKRYLSYLGYAAYFICVLVFLDRALPNNIHSLKWAAFKTILFLLFYSPLFIRFNQKFSFFKLLRELVGTRLQRNFRKMEPTN
jgi:O-antigen/teichoic acid export membrane protein